LAECGQLSEALNISSDTGWPRGIELDRLPDETQADFEKRWNAHLEKLLDTPARRTPVEALHQAAIRALERGHFGEADKLIQHARSHYRDHVYLATAHARLLVETGRTEEAVRFLFELEKELTGRENAVVEGALFEALLEVFRLCCKPTGTKKMNDQWSERIVQLPQPIFDGEFRREHYLHPQLARLVTQNAKAYWYGACGQIPRERKNTDIVVAALRDLGTPAALNLSARILASYCQWDDVSIFTDKACKDSKDRQTQIRSWNTKARILLDHAAAGDSSALEKAGKALAQSEDLDSGNSYTMLLRAEWLERSGFSGKAAEVRLEADQLRKIQPCTAPDFLDSFF
jgi:hypothetical protein